MSLLYLLPGVSPLRYVEIAVVVVVVGLLGASGITLQHQVAAQKVVIAQREKTISDMREQYAAAAASASASNLAELNRRLAAQKVDLDANLRFAKQASADALARAASSDRLRGATAVIAARCGFPTDHSTAVAAGPAASAPGDLLADVQRRLEEAAGRIGEYADQLRPAAEQCVADYRALSPVGQALKAP